MNRLNYCKEILLLLFIIMLISNKATAQIGGISGSKLGAYCVDVVDNKKVEFEPGITYFSSGKSWDNNGNLKNRFNSTDSLNHSTVMNIRITYGLGDVFEIGGTFSTDLSMSNLGLRYVLHQDEKLGLALIAGTNIPLGNKPTDESKKSINNSTSAGLGVVASYQFDENLSLDFNIQGQSYLTDIQEKNKGSYFINSDLGYYLYNHQLQLIAGFGFQYSKFENFSSNSLTIYPGVTIETGANYIIVFSTPFDVAGKNANKSFGANLALTLTFE